MAKDPKDTKDKKEKETKADVFKRLANKRVGKAIKTIGIISHLRGYPHTPEQTQKIGAALRTAVEQVMDDLARKEDKKEESFSL